MPERPDPPGEVLFRFSPDPAAYYEEYAVTIGARGGVTFWGFPRRHYRGHGLRWEVTREKGPVVVELLRRLSQAGDPSCSFCGGFHPLDPLGENDPADGDHKRCDRCGPPFLPLE